MEKDAIDGLKETIKLANENDFKIIGSAIFARKSIPAEAFVS